MCVFVCVFVCVRVFVCVCVLGHKIVPEARYKYLLVPAVTCAGTFRKNFARKPMYPVPVHVPECTGHHTKTHHCTDV